MRGSGKLTKAEHHFFLQLRRSFCAWPKACVHRNRISLTIKVGKQETRPRRRQKKSVTSDNGDGGPTLSTSIAIAVREGRSTDKQDFAFDKSCSHTKRWMMAFFVRVAFDSTSRTPVRASCLWFDKAELFHFNGVRWTTKSVGI